MNVKKDTRMLVKVTNVPGNGYHVAFLVGRNEDNPYTLASNLCGMFTEQTGISLARGESKVFSLKLTPQRKKRAAAVR